MPACLVFVNSFQETPIVGMALHAPDEASRGDKETRDPHHHGGDAEVPVVPALPVATPVAVPVDAETMAQYIAKLQSAQTQERWPPSSPAVLRPGTIPGDSFGIARAAMGVYGGAQPWGFPGYGPSDDVLLQHDVPWIPMPGYIAPVGHYMAITGGPSGAVPAGVALAALPHLFV
eukprot:IDg2999t1